MKRQQQTKIKQALSSHSQASILTPKRLVSSLHQALWQSVNGQVFSKTMLFGALGILPFTLLSTTAQSSELDVYEVNSPTISGGSAPTIMMAFDVSASMTAESVANSLLVNGNSTGVEASKVDYPTIGCNLQALSDDEQRSSSVDNPENEYWYNRTYKIVGYRVLDTKTVNINGREIQYNLTGCKATASQGTPGTEGYIAEGSKLYDRRSRLLSSVIDLLANTNPNAVDEHNKPLPYVKNSVKIGLASFSSKIDDDLDLYDGKTGQILVPARPLTVAQRAELIEAMANLSFGSNTPTASALAEVGAYMLGTHTYDELINKKVAVEVGTLSERPRGKIDYFKYSVCPLTAKELALPLSSEESLSDTQKRIANKLAERGYTHFAYCDTPSMTADSDNFDFRVDTRNESRSDKLAANPPAEYGILKYNETVTTGGTEKYTRYYLTYSGKYPKTEASGFPYSKSATKNSTDYISPLSEKKECGGGDGIFLLTDGNPTKVISHLKSSAVASVAQARFLAKNNETVQNLMNKSLYKINNKRREELGESATFVPLSANCNVEPSKFTNKYNFSYDTGLLHSSVEYPALGCMASYAKILREEANIKTAILGLGKIFNGIDSKDGIYDCSSVDVTDSENPEFNKKGICYLAEKGQGYGEGGFYFAQSATDIANSLSDFVNSFEVKDYEAQPNDGPSVSIDPTNSTDNRSIAYLPMMLPKPGTSNLIWEGNLKKYKINKGTLFDANNKPLYSGINGQINKGSFDKWNKTSTPDGGDILSSGVYAKLLGPDTGDLSSVRNVFVENKAGGTASKITVSGTAPQGLAGLGYSRQRQQYLLNFLGYTAPVAGVTESTTYVSGKDPLRDISNYAPSSPKKVLGGINNSKPQELLYSYTKEVAIGDLSAEPTIKQEYKVLYGSMDGALHLIDAGTGEEEFAFIPNVVVNDTNQVAALKKDSTTNADGETNKAGLVFGVDAPWYVRSKYNRIDKVDGGKVTTTVNLSNKDKDGNELNEADKPYIKAYGGLGRGGIGIYGLNITDPKKPSIMFHKTTETSGPFAHLGRTWSAPVASKVKYKANDTAKEEIKDVLFVSGGYSLCYDIPEFILDSSEGTLKEKIIKRGLETECLTEDGSKTKTQTIGNAVYMIDAETGDLLWSTSSANLSPSGSEYTQNEHLKHSIPAAVGVMDKDKDGLVDSIYFADLGGQLFRADFDDDIAIQPTSGSSPKWAKRVVRLLNTAQADKPTLRFFHTPAVSAYRIDDENKSTSSKSGYLHLIVSLASGDRSSPLAKLDERQADTQPNKLISVWDSDFPKGDLLTKVDSSLTIKDLTLSDLYPLQWTEEAKGLTPAQKTDLRTETGKKGWYDNLTYFSGKSSQGNVIKSVNGTADDANVVGNNVSYLKVISEPTLRAGRLFVPVYNRLAYIPSDTSCSPVPTGVSEAQEYCMPFGNCDGISSGAQDNGRGKSYILGSGIGSVTIASGEGSNRGYLLTPEPVKDAAPENGPDSVPSTSNPLSAIKDVFYSLYKLLPNQWFERNPEGS